MRHCMYVRVEIFREAQISEAHETQLLCVDVEAVVIGELFATLCKIGLPEI